MSDVVDRFIAAFNNRDREALRDLLAADATAEVLDAGFGTEQGPDAIVRISLAHMLDPQATPLVARRPHRPQEDLVLFFTENTLDCAARLVARDARIVRIEYLVRAFREAEVEALAAAEAE